MELKVFLLCFALFVAATTAASVCKCGPDQKDSPINSAVAKYTLKRTKDGKDFDEKVEIDTEKETEVVHVPRTSPDEEEADIVLDFKKKLTMLRMPEAKSCYLSKSTDGVPKPADLKQLLDAEGGIEWMAKHKTELKFRVAGLFNDRSVLSDEMANLCAKLPIYLLVKKDPGTDDTEVQRVDKAPEIRLKPRYRFRRECKEVCETYSRTTCVLFVFCWTVETENCRRECDS